MGTDKYYQEIECILSDLPKLERRLQLAEEDVQRVRIERSLKMRNKRFERLIPFQFRLQLRTLCQHAGVKGEFL